MTDRNTIVVKDGGSSTGVILGILIGPGAGSTSQPSDINVNVELPSVAPNPS